MNVHAYTNTEHLVPSLDVLLHPPSSIAATAAILLALFGPLSMIDGVYLHLVRYRLWARRESRREHLLHTLRAFLFIPVALFVLSGATGAAFVIGMVALAIDQLVELFDVIEENASRREIGGLPRGEYALHIVLVTLRASVVALALALRPGWAWSISAHGSASPALAWLGEVSMQFVPGAVIVALVHVALLLVPARAALRAAR
jgi:hypothetical protein